MSIEQLGFVQFKTHRVVVSQDDSTGRIYCFKHTDRQCDLASFDREDLASEYIITPPDRIQYYVNLGED